MKKILCSKFGKIKKYTYVDDADYDWLNSFHWSAHKTRGGLWCAEKSIKWGKGRKTQKMHRLILKAKKGQEVDHINRNGLDNRRANLRICTRSENLINRGLFKNKKNSIYFGVIKVSVRRLYGMYIRYFGQIKRDGKEYYTKYYRTQKEAHLARQRLVEKFSTT